MEYKEFVENTICGLDPSSFEQIKEILLGEKFIEFSIIKPNEISADILAEKIADYFETFEIKANRPFNKQLEVYMNEIDAIVAPRIAKTPQQKKGDNTPPNVPRARRYYEKYLTYKAIKDITIRQLLDYTRIMMSLYTASVNDENKPVENFEYSVKCLDVKKLLENLKKEETFIVAILQNKRKRFELKDKYANDTCILIILIIALCMVINEQK